MLDKTERILVRFSAFMAIIGGIGLIFATLVTCSSIALKMVRRTLDTVLPQYADPVPWAFIRPILGEEELVTYGVGLALFSALPWLMIQRGHIKIDLFQNYFSISLNRFLDLLGDVIFAVIGYLILTRQWFLIFKKTRKSEEPMLVEILQGNFEVVANRLRDSQVSQIIGLPLWPTYITAEICILAFFLVATFCVLRSTNALFLGVRS